MGKEKMGKGLLTALIAAIVLVVAVAAVAVVIVLRRNAGPELTAVDPNATMSPDLLPGIGSVVIGPDDPEPTSPWDNDTGSFTTMFNGVWSFADYKTASVDAVCGNDASNPMNIFVTLVIPGIDHPVYTSPTIPPGGRLEGITLSEPLEAGTYDCVLVHHLLDREGVEASTVQFEMSIHVG
jgi:hypothetical protein